VTRAIEGLDLVTAVLAREQAVCERAPDAQADPWRAPGARSRTRQSAPTKTGTSDGRQRGHARWPRRVDFHRRGLV